MFSPCFSNRHYLNPIRGYVIYRFPQEKTYQNTYKAKFIVILVWYSFFSKII